MAKVYMYGETFGRGESWIVKRTLDLDLFEKTLQYLHEEDEEALDKLMEEGFDVSAVQVLEGMGNDQLEDHIAAWKRGVAVADMNDNGMYVFDRTKDEARAAYLKFNEECLGSGSDDWDE